MLKGKFMIPQWMGLTAIFGIITAGFGYIRQVFNYLSSFIIVRSELKGELPVAMSIYCWQNLKRSPFGNRQFKASRHFVKPMERYAIVSYESIGDDPVVFWDGWKPLFLGEKQDGSTVSGNSMKITFIRGMWKLDDLIIACTKIGNEKIKRSNRAKRYYVERFAGSGPLAGRRGGATSGSNTSSVEAKKSATSTDSLAYGDTRLLQWNINDIGQETESDGKALDRLAMPVEVDTLVNELRRWKESEPWYKAKKIPWRRGWLLYGPPGTGKTSLVRAVAQDLDMPVFMFDLASMSNDELVSSWKQMMGSVPCVALFEDIDGVFEGRENRLGEQGGGLTFDCLLNVLGGIEAADGVFTVITTNCIDKLDAALGKPRDCGDSDENMISTRPGRIDRAFELTTLNESQRRRIAERILTENVDCIEELVRKGDGDTGAQFQERCGQLALKAYWEGKEGMIIPAADRVEKPFGESDNINIPRGIGIDYSTATAEELSEIHSQLASISIDQLIHYAVDANSYA